MRGDAPRLVLRAAARERRPRDMFGTRHQRRSHVYSAGATAERHVLQVKKDDASAPCRSLVRWLVLRYSSMTSSLHTEPREHGIDRARGRLAAARSSSGRATSRVSALGVPRSQQAHPSLGIRSSDARSRDIRRLAARAGGRAGGMWSERRRRRSSETHEAPARRRQWRSHRAVKLC